jgi:glycine/D-amino acid oxidase-like deaminating enzyme
VLPDGLVEVETDLGTYRTEKLVLAAGAWMDQLVPELKGLCVPGRATVAWMKVMHVHGYARSCTCTCACLWMYDDDIMHMHMQQLHVVSRGAGRVAHVCCT